MWARSIALTAVVAGFALPGAAIAGAASITGTVTAESGGAPIQNVCVDAEGPIPGSAITDASGNYEIPDLLDEHPYTLSFRPCAGSGLNYAPEWFNNKPSSGQADEFVLPAEGADIDAALTTGARISGTVTGDAGTPGPLAGICASASGPAWSAQDTTDGAGAYEIVGLPAGSYAVQFVPCGDENLLPEYYDDKQTAEAATPVVVAAGGTVTGRNAVLSTGGSITGTVLGSDGQPAANVFIQADLVGGDTSYVATTNAGGQYTVKALPTGSYKVGFFPDGSSGDISEYYDNKPTHGSANTVAVTAGSNRANINASLDAGAEIRGTITDAASGDPSVTSCAIALNAAGERVGSIGSADGMGDYKITGLAQGTYRVEFDNNETCDSDPEYAPEFWNDEHSFSSAGTVTLTAAEIRNDIDGALDVGGKISGTVTNGGTGLNAEFVCVELFTTGGDPTGIVTATDAMGQYSLRGLVPGSYKVRFDGSCGDPTLGFEFYDDVATAAEATSVSVALGAEADGIDAEMTPAPAVTLGVLPDASTNDNTPTFNFAAQYESLLECSLDKGTAAYGPCTTGTSHTAGTLADGNWTFRVRVTNPTGSDIETYDFNVDTQAPPAPAITGPNGFTNDNTPTFSAPQPPGVTPYCSLDQGVADFELCDDGLFSQITALPDGVYTFRARGIDSAGNEGAVATRGFIIDTVAPTVEITGGPTGAIDDTTPTFDFDPEEGAALSCSVDTGAPAYGGCSGATTHTAAALAPGSYTFRVRASDPAGNSTVDVRSFSLNAPPAPPPQPPPPAPKKCKKGQKLKKGKCVKKKRRKK